MPLVALLPSPIMGWVVRVAGELTPARPSPPLPEREGEEVLAGLVVRGLRHQCWAPAP